VVPPVCPDDGESDIAPSGPIDRSALPPGFTLPADPAQQKAVAFALGAVGMPYVFGAKGPTAYDCSGLTQAAWAAAGVGVSAGTLTQIHDGVPVSGLAEVEPGDLLFTPGSLGTPTHPRHVGIYLGHGLLVDAHSTKAGVILERLEAWRNTIVAIRRVGGPGSAAGPLPSFPVPAAAGAAP
jgi:cell wall-associated NlpC family hydrolase